MDEKCKCKCCTDVGIDFWLFLITMAIIFVLKQ